MGTITNITILIVAFEHILFLVLEMFLWKTPTCFKVFGMTAASAEATAKLAANQGLYNGFLAAGLLWALLSANREIAVFFLACVSIAGVFGGITVNRTILFVQAVPALFCLAIFAIKLIK